MSVTIEDLKPKPFTVNIKGLELQCKPLRLSHALIVAKVGNIFQDSKASKQEIKQAEVDIDEVIVDLIPELKGIQLDMNLTIELIQQLMEHVEPADNKELKNKGVAFDTDPKA